MTTYNLSFMDNTTSLLEIAAGVNTESGDWLFGILLLFIFILIFMVFSDYDRKNVLLADSFITTIIAGLFFGAGLVQGWVLGLPIAVLVITLIVKIWGDT